MKIKDNVEFVDKYEQFLEQTTALTFEQRAEAGRQLLDYLESINNE